MHHYQFSYCYNFLNSSAFLFGSIEVFQRFWRNSDNGIQITEESQSVRSQLHQTHPRWVCFWGLLNPNPLSFSPFRSCLYLTNFLFFCVWLCFIFSDSDWSGSNFLIVGCNESWICWKREIEQCEVVDWVCYHHHCSFRSVL